jgi:hypothetical protein
MVEQGLSFWEILNFPRYSIIFTQFKTRAKKKTKNNIFFHTKYIIKYTNQRVLEN